MNDLYDRPDQEFESEKKGRGFLRQKDRISCLEGCPQADFAQSFYQYAGTIPKFFLRAVPKMMDLGKWDIDEAEWMKHVEEVKENFKSHNIAMNDVSAYLYLYDLITGRRTDFEMRYAFIDEIQDYTPFQLAYLKYNFPRAKFTMLGDLNQAIFTKDESRSLLKQISGLFDPEKKLMWCS